MVSGFLLLTLALRTELRDDHASYFVEWLNVPQNDKRVIFCAAMHVQKAWIVSMA